MTRLRRVVLTGVLPATLALLVAVLVLAVVLLVLGVDPVKSLVALFDFGETPQAQANQMRAWVEGVVPLFLSGLAVSLGFRMGLFNIGVEGQYRIAALVAAWFAATVPLPGALAIILTIIVAMLAGALYALIPAVLKVTRGVNEVITTIMLNSIVGGLIGYLLRGPFRDPKLGETGTGRTADIRTDAWFPGFEDPFGWLGMLTPSRPLGGFIVVALIVGVAVALGLNRTRFGFNLRASGSNPEAAATSGVQSSRMIVQAMLLSGGIAGLVGLPQILGDVHAYGADSFFLGFGFSGIAVALLGRNNPLGIGLAAILFAFLNRSGPSLQNVEVPPSVVSIAQGVIVLSVVIVNEVLRRRLLRMEDRKAAAQTPATPAAPGTSVSGTPGPATAGASA
ncbi:MAG TPA: ABC transporter permease [Dermatophilaceae bacterium]|jgi:simple sugar transport system permease protein|nr:ABC transporter permease [Dermatophilaceae bacterium]